MTPLLKNLSAIFVIIYFQITENDMIKKLKAYHTVSNKHLIEETLNYLTNDFELFFIDYEIKVNKEQMKDILGWDKAVNSTSTYRNLRIMGDSITGLFTEKNDFFRLLGKKKHKAIISYHFNDNGLIYKQTYKSLPNQSSYQGSLQKAVHWARQNQSGEIAEIYQNNQLHFNEEMGIRWINLLRKWKKATEDQ